MLTLQLEKRQFYDGVNEIFLYSKAQTVRLEHSLISISKWEAHWHKPFLPGPKGPGMSGYHEELYYIECMLIGNIDEQVPTIILLDHQKTIHDYIGNPQTATTIHRIGNRPPNTKTVTSELVYYWMIKFNVPFECEKWHFNRLLTLIDVCNVSESQGVKGNRMNALESARYKYELNRQRQGL